VCVLVNAARDSSGNREIRIRIDRNDEIGSCRAPSTRWPRGAEERDTSKTPSDVSYPRGCYRGGRSQRSWAPRRGSGAKVAFCSRTCAVSCLAQGSLRSPCAAVESIFTEVVAAVDGSRRLAWCEKVHRDGRRRCALFGRPVQYGSSKRAVSAAFALSHARGLKRIAQTRRRAASKVSAIHTAKVVWFDRSGRTHRIRCGGEAVSIWLSRMNH